MFITMGATLFGYVLTRARLDLAIEGLSLIHISVFWVINTKALTYTERGKFALLDKPVPRILEDRNRPGVRRMACLLYTSRG